MRVEKGSFWQFSDDLPEFGTFHDGLGDVKHHSWIQLVLNFALGFPDCETLFGTDTRDDLARLFGCWGEGLAEGIICSFQLVSFL